MNMPASLVVDGTRNVMRQLLTASVLGQLNMKGGHEKVALSETEVYALVTHKLTYILLPTHICCLPYSPP